MVSQEVPHSVNLAALITCLTLALVAVAARTIARRAKEHAVVAEDYFCWIAVASFIAFVGLYLDILDFVYVISDVTNGKIAPPATFMSDGDHMMRCLFAIQLLFWVTLYSVKISLLCLFRRLILGLPAYQKLWIGVVIFTVLSFIGSFISELTSCKPTSAYFHFGQCNKPEDAKAQATSLYFSLAVDLLTDILIMLIPMRLLWNLQISRIEKISVGVVMCVGVVTMICAIVRTSSLGALARVGQIPISWLALWASIEGLVAIVVNCLPSFAIVVRKQITTIRSTTNSNSGPHTQNTLSSQQKNVIRSESMLLDDMGPVETGRRSVSSRDGSENSTQYNDTAYGIKGRGL